VTSTPPVLKNHLFISYSRRDSNFVDRVITALAERGMRTWVDRSAIVGGAVWKASITEAIRDCVAFLIVVSPHSSDSENVPKELTLAERHNRPIIPVRYEDCALAPAMEYDLAELQFVDFCGNTFDDALEELVRAIGAEKANEVRRSSGGQPPQLQFCIHCGARIPVGNLFCIRCGVRIER
jgi:hypothetical protein